MSGFIRPDSETSRAGDAGLTEEMRASCAKLGAGTRPIRIGALRGRAAAWQFQGRPRRAAELQLNCSPALDVLATARVFRGVRLLSRPSYVAAALLLCLVACENEVGAPVPMNGPSALVLSLRITPDTVQPDDVIRLEIRADNPSTLPIRLGRAACPEDLLVLNLLEPSGAVTPTISGIPCKLPTQEQFLAVDGTIAKSLQTTAYSVLRTRVPGSYRLRLDYWSGTTRVIGPSQWVELR